MAKKKVTSDFRPDSIRVGDTPVGKGVFAAQSFPAGAVIGEIAGDIVADGLRDPCYTFEMYHDMLLDPHPPFRYLNHCCDPNCEFDCFEKAGPGKAQPPLYLIALRDIPAGEELTIDYNWPAEYAIPCGCNSPACRGWIVCLDEIGSLRRKRTKIR